jgi:hypothetical protein
MSERKIPEKKGGKSKLKSSFSYPLFFDVGVKL